MVGDIAVVVSASHNLRILFFHFLREGGAVLSVGRCSILQGGRRQGFPDKYARSARKIYRETALPPDLADDRMPCITFAPAGG